MAPILIIGFVLALVAEATAQQTDSPRRVGYLSAIGASLMSDRTEAFRQGLRDLGYVEGKNIAVEWRYADGKLDRLRGLVSELVRLRVETIVSGGGSVTRVAKKERRRFPLL